MAIHMIDYFQLMNWTDALMKDKHIKYQLGAKPALSARPEDITRSDCSGFVRYLICNSSSRTINFGGGGGGTWWQNKWCRDQSLEVVNYDTAREMDGLLRVAFMHGGGGHIGHVWLILSGQTIECHGGVGADRRAWDTAILKNNVDVCYKLAWMIAPDISPRRDVMYA